MQSPATMKVFLVLASFVTVVYGGVGVLTASEENEALELWKKFCIDNAEETSDGNTFYFCKNAIEETEETVTHRIDVTEAPEEHRQVIFVQPPTINYKHNVTINGQPAKQQKTTIYVLPRKNTHSLDYVDNRPATVPPEKPSLFFLKKSPEKGGY